jgi:pimeloyl-ACP methyl ester carboxylesterase
MRPFASVGRCIAVGAGILSFLTNLATAQDSGFTRATAQRLLREVRRITTPNGIEQLTPVRIGGVRQWISVRGRDTANPILLFLHGGPGFAEMPASWIYQSALEDHFTVVQWDQRGAGKSTVDENGQPLSPTITYERMVQDVVEMVEHLRKTYRRQRIFVAGHSWGSIIGLELARTHPDWLHAYIGIGQVIHSEEAEKVSYAFAIDEARKRGNKEALAQLEGIAPYPDANGGISLKSILLERRWINAFGGMSYGREGLDYELGARVLSPEWTDADLKADDGGGTLTRLMSSLLATNFTRVTRFECPVVIFAGRHDYAVPSIVAERWFETITAPAKRFIWFENSAHMVQMEQPGLFAMHLINDVRPLLERHGDGRL